MIRYSTNEAAKRLGTSGATLVRHMKAGKIPMPQVIQAGLSTVHSWTDADLERVRKILPKIANGRKTRYQKLREKGKPPAGAPVPHKSHKTKKKK